MRHAKRFRPSLILGLSGLIWLACTEGPATIDGLLSLRLTPRDVILASLGDTVFVSAELSRAGVPVELSGVVWGLVDQGIIEIRPAGSSLARAQGFVVARAPGVARIWVMASGRSDTAAIEVRQLATLIRIARSTEGGSETVSALADTLREVNDTVRFLAVARDRRGYEIRGARLNWRSSDTTIVSVIEGLVRGRRRGRATVTVSTQGVTDSVSVVVGSAGSVTRVAIAGANYVQNAIGDSTQLTLNAFDANGQPVPGAQASWVSRAPSIATVNAQGIVIGQQPGYAVIVGSSNGFSDSTTIQVRQVPANVVVLPNVHSLVLNGTYTFGSAVRDSNGVAMSGASLTWASSNTTVATVSGATVTARALGNATISATHQSLTGTAALTVTAVPPPPPPVPVASVTVTPPSSSIQIGATVQLTATMRDSANNVLTGRAVTWSSTNTAFATVSGTGLVQGVGAGTATITATSEGRTGTASVTITTTGGGTQPPGNPGTPIMATSNVNVDTFSVTARWPRATNATRYDWLTGSDNNAWTANGTVTDTSVVFRAPRITGNTGYFLCIIAFNSAGAPSAQNACAAYTAPAGGPVPVATVTVAPNPASVLVGATVQLTPTLRDASNNVLTGRVVTWSSTATGVATVNASGLVTGVTAGSATITATSEGRTGTASLTVSVTPPPPPVPVATVTVSPASPSIQTGATVQLTATLRDANNNVLTGRVVTWSSSATGVVTVSATGLVTGVAAGSRTITATSEGRTGTASVTVTAPPPPVPVATVTVSPASPSIQAGSTVQLTATLRDASNNILTGRVVTWSSSATGVATANASGLVTGVAAGSATITATSETRTGTATVSVTAPPPPPPPPAGVIWFSDWSAATGLSDLAVTDGGTLSGGSWVGGKWDYITCWPADIMRVVPGAPLGWTLTPNVLEMTDRGETACDLLELDNAIPSGRSFYIRAYIRVEPGVGANNHPFKLNAGGGAGPVQGVMWANNTNSNTTYTQKMQFPNGSTPANYNSWALASQHALQTNTWYRHEWFIEIVNMTTRQYRIWPRIYDMQGNLLHDATHFLIGDPSSDQTTLAQWYASGGGDRFTDLNLARRFTLGMEGPGGAPVTNRHWYYAAVAACLSTWCGPR